MSMEITLDTRAFQEALQKIADKTLPAAIDRGLYKWGERTMGQIKGDPAVPVMDGPLRASGVVLPVVRNGTLHTLTMGFGGPAVRYAVKVHENPRAGKTDGWGPGGPREIAFRRIKGRVVPIGARRKKWAKVGGYKFLEAPMAESGPKIPETIAAEVR